MRSSYFGNRQEGRTELVEHSLDSLSSTLRQADIRGNVVIFLHTSEHKSSLPVHYRNAVNEAVELYIVSAYLTEWSPGIDLPAACKRFRFIVGSDFGITRKKACNEVLNWLPASRKADFLVADEISGFHPKAAFWRNAAGQCFMLAGSSNLSRAAFESNVEANMLSAISPQEFEEAKAWIDWIEERSVPVSEGWLARYVEAKRQPGKSRGSRVRGGLDSPVVTFKLPRPRAMTRLLKERREQLLSFAEHRTGLLQLLRNCAAGSLKSKAFFAQLPEHWSHELGDRLQGKGWERLGKSANFKELSAAFVSILDARKQDRDDVVRSALDRLHESGNPARKAFLSELLCLCFPAEYPVLNEPVNSFRSKNRFSAPRGASEGARYIDLARKLRVALRQDPEYPAKNLAELDLLIWASSPKKRRR